MPFELIEIKPEHDSRICEIIKQVGAEFGAVGEGYGPSDSEVFAMSQHYKDELSSQYLIAVADNSVIGGCGIAPFNVSKQVCELRKLFLLPENRGLGVGKKLAEACLTYAKNKGFKSCYLDTLTGMTSAIKLYETLGFEHLDKPLEGTIHNGCDVWMLKPL
mgnify:CR=1 FL=1